MQEYLNMQQVVGPGGVNMQTGAHNTGTETVPISEEFVDEQENPLPQDVLMALCIFCAVLLPPVGIIAIVFAIQSRKAAAQDEPVIAARKSYNARLALIVGFVFGFFGWLTLGLKTF